MRPLMFAAAVLSGTPDVQPPPPPAAEQTNVQSVPDEGEGGPYEPVEPVTVIVEGEPLEAPPAFSIAPDPALERRYAPRERAPLNRVTMPF